MKKKLLLTLIVLISILHSLSAAVQTTWFYDQLDKGGKELYDRIGKAVISTEEKIDGIDKSVTAEECLRIFSGYLDDHPGIFWVEPKIRYGTYLDGEKAKHSIYFTYSHLDTLKSDKTRFVNMVSKFSYYLQKDPNDWLKLYHIYDYLASNVEYSLDYMDQSMWSVFFSGIGVCAGFARSFQYLALQEGIPAVVVHGWSRNEDGTAGDVPHLWVMAQIEGKWYHFDPTWGLDSGDGDVDFTYFCRSRARMELTHVIDEDYPIPQSGDDSMSYVVKRHRYISSYSRERFENVLLAAVKNKENTFTVELPSPGEFDKAVDDLVKAGGISDILNENALSFTSYGIKKDSMAYSICLSLKK